VSRPDPPDALGRARDARMDEQRQIRSVVDQKILTDEERGVFARSHSSSMRHF
jgi:hypothetical protein